MGEISNNIIIYNLSCFDCFDTYLIQTTQERVEKKSERPGINLQLNRRLYNIVLQISLVLPFPKWVCLF